MLPGQNDVSLLVEEYATLVAESGGVPPMREGSVDWETLASLLASDAEWTTQGATTVLTLAQQYGAFVLRNALALALALDAQDGSFGL